MKLSETMKWIEWLSIISSLLAVCGASQETPNIVIFLADDLGIGDLGCFGNDTMKTPNIDRIASEGAKLTHHIAASSVCTPSRAAILTGRYPIRMGMTPSSFIRVNIFTASTSGIPNDENTFAKVAQSRGYKTGLIGKWHLGIDCQWRGDHCSHPLNLGFDYYYGLPLTNLKDFGNPAISGSVLSPKIRRSLFFSALGGVVASFFFKKIHLFGPKLTGFFIFICISIPLLIFAILSHLHLLDGIVMRNHDVVEQPVRLYDNFTQKQIIEGVNFLKARQEDQKPFLLYMSWVHVHTALHAGPAFQNRSAHSPYGDDVEEMDWATGQIMNALEDMNFLNNTFVYFSSDNGGYLEEKDALGRQAGGWNGIYKGGKGQGGQDGGIRVPSLAMWRGQIPPGSEISVPTSQMDVLPALTQLIGASPPENQNKTVDGKNMLPLLLGQTKKSPHEFLFHYCGVDIHAARYIPKDDDVNIWKVHYATPNWVPGGDDCGDFLCQCYGNSVTWRNPPLLYNIGVDPSEDHPLNVTDHKEIVDKLYNAVQEHKLTIAPVTNQMAVAKLLPRPWLQPCCNFPTCHCVDPAFPEQ